MAFSPMLSLGIVFAGILQIIKAGVLVWAYFRTKKLAALVYAVFSIVDRIYQYIIVPVITSRLWENSQGVLSGDDLGWTLMDSAILLRTLPYAVESALFIWLVVSLSSSRRSPQS
ncbi:MAG: hypothetical protein AAF722_08710 [Cyanobacteria bacterium P01_C01_bin.70]